MPINVQTIILGATNHLLAGVAKPYISAYAIWNLDFFRALMPDICLQLTTLQVLALAYLIAVYPMLLMVIAYTLVELHGYGFRPVLLVWRPFHYFFVRFQREWNIQTSLSSFSQLQNYSMSHFPSLFQPYFIMSMVI